jgi:hypothetical protein
VGGSASAGPFALQAAYEKGPCQLATAGAEALPLSSRPSNLLREEKQVARTCRCEWYGCRVAAGAMAPTANACKGWRLSVPLQCRGEVNNMDDDKPRPTPVPTARDGLAKILTVPALSLIGVLVGALVGYVKARGDIEVRYVEIALGVLADKGSEGTQAMREWAVDVLNERGPVRLDGEARRQVVAMGLRPSVAAGSAQLDDVVATGSIVGAPASPSPKPRSRTERAPGPASQSRPAVATGGATLGGTLGTGDAAPAVAPSSAPR